MRKSNTGRVVIDITPEQKQAIYAELKARGGMTMREWFIQQAIKDGLCQSEGATKGTQEGNPEC